MGRANNFKKALSHLKSNQIDEKLQMLSEIPTNSTLGMYEIEPTIEVQDPDIPGEVTREANFDKDDLDNGKDTTGLFDNDGTILTIEPPGDTDYILGPMSSMWYAWGNFTQIGYINEDTRKMTNLARITGELDDWDGSSNFTSYGQLTLEQAVWFRDTNRREYRAFYPGPPSSVADRYGRYICSITGTSKQVSITPPLRRTGGTRGGPGDFNIWGFNLKGMVGSIGNFLTKISKGPEEFFPKGTLVGNALQDALKGGVKHSAEYNALLPVYLGLSILTGQKLQIPVSPTAAKNISKKINASALNDVLRINSPTPTTAKETIKPSSGKNSNVIQDKMGWGAQGGLNFNYNTQTKQLEITSNKTLRTTSGGETVTTAKEFGKMASPGKITSFSDIPTPTKQQIYDTSTKLISAVSQRLGGPGLDPTLPIDIQLKGMSDKYDSNDISRIAVELGTKIISTTTQGAASNIVALRKVLVDNGIVPKSDIEKIGGAYGQVSTTVNIDYNDLPKDVQKVISSKTQLTQNYDPPGQVLSESRQRILRDIKKPVVIPEVKQEKIKHRPRVIGSGPRVVGDDLMKQVECQPSFKQPEDRMWGKFEKNKNARKSQQRKNDVLEIVGASDHAWDYLSENGRKKGEDIVYGNFGGKKIRVVKQENVRSDTLLFLADESGNKTRVLQSEINDNLDYQFNKELFEKYFDEQQTMQYDNDPLFKKVSKRLKAVIDYPDKPAKAGYPDEPPPEMVNGWHPEYGQDKGYYNKLDPQSASSMPNTGNPEIDAKVQKARRIKRIAKGD